MTAPLRITDMTIDEPLRVIGRRGRRTPSTLLALDRRDELLREVARRFFVGMSDREAARRLRAKLLCYRAGVWRRSCSDPSCRHQAERIEAFLFELLRVRDSIPSERLIRAVLSRTASVP